MSYEEDEQEDKRQCYQFKDTGTCNYEARCRFWHGDQAPGAQRRDFGGRDDGGRSGGRDFGGNRGGSGGSRGICYDFRDNGSCRFGDRCRFSHGDGGSEPRGGSRDGGSESRGGRFDDGGYRGGNRGGNSGGQSQGICYQFRDNGDCRFGDRCRFNHESSDKDM